jgi:predicted lysophospholipase L1 biosynthesis ABC-type transport system permease subunit
VSDAEAATLPTAGLTALRTLELAGSVLARRVLITGASGGVGQYAVQLGSLAGAAVTALVRDVKRSGDLVRHLGAVEVVSASMAASTSSSTRSAARRSPRRSSTLRRVAASSTSRPGARTKSLHSGRNSSTAPPEPRSTRSTCGTSWNGQPPPTSPDSFNFSSRGS